MGTLRLRTVSTAKVQQCELESGGLLSPVETSKDSRGTDMFANTSGGQQALFAEHKGTGAAAKRRVVNPRPEQTVGSHPGNREERYQRHLHRLLIWTMCPPRLSGSKRGRKLQVLERTSKRVAWFPGGNTSPFCASSHRVPSIWPSGFVVPRGVDVNGARGRLDQNVAESCKPWT